MSRTQNIGWHRGRPRLWMEGAWLADMGFPKGMPYKVAFGPNAIEFAACGIGATDGERRVSGKQKAGQWIPIIDINGSCLQFSGKVTIDGGAGVMTVRPAERLKETA